MKTYILNTEVKNITYRVEVDEIENIYKKIKIFKDDIDVSQEIMDSHEIFDKILGNLQIHKNHHTTPKFLIKDWIDDGVIHELKVDIKNNKTEIIIKSLPTKDNVDKYLSKKFCSLHKHTFFFQNSIVIFEGYLVNTIEKFIEGILDYIKITENNENKRIKDATITINNSKINITQEIIKRSKFIHNGIEIKNILDIDIKTYNRIIVEQYMHILFLYSSIDNYSLFFENIFNHFENFKNNYPLETVSLDYFGKVINQTQEKLKEFFTHGYVTGYINTQKTGLSISEIWKFECHDAHKNLSVIIPLTSKYSVIISSNNEAFKALKAKLEDKNISIEKYTAHQIKMIIQHAKTPKYKKGKKGNRVENNIYSIFMPNYQYAELMREFLKNKIITE